MEVISSFIRYVSFLCVHVTAQNEATQLREEATLPIEELLERYGGAGLLVNQALANMKKGGIGKVLSPVIRAKPSLSAEEGSEGSTSESQDPTAESDSSGSEPCLSKKDQIAVNLADSISNGFCKEDEDVAKTSTETVAKNDSSAVVNSADGAASSLQENGTASAADCDSVNVESSTAGEVHSRVLESGTSDAADCGEAGGSCVDDEPGPSCSAAEVHMSKMALYTEYRFTKVFKYTANINSALFTDYTCNKRHAYCVTADSG